MKCRSIALGAVVAIAWAIAQTPSAPVSPRTRQAAVDPMQDLVASALITGLRGRFDGRDVELRRVHVQRGAGEAVAQPLEASAMFRLEGGEAWMPVRLDAFVDAASGELDPVGISLGPREGGAVSDAGAVALDRSALDKAVRARLVAEFPGQPVTFELGNARRMAGDARYQLVNGTGVARFGAEGDARVRIAAVYDARAQAWLGVDYELGGPV